MSGRRIIRDRQELPRPILELMTADPVSVKLLFQLVNEFAIEKRNRDLVIERAQAAIKQVYEKFTPDQKVQFFAMLYDQFSDRYDQHMGVETRHYQAIRTVLQFAAPFLRTPIVDLTAGTGEPMKYVLEILERSRKMRDAGIDDPLMAPVQDCSVCPVHINEVSPKMLEKAWGKLGRGIGHTNMSAYDFSIKGYNTVVCSQTFHLIDDKPLLVRAISNALVPGGIAVVMEEDPFRISQVLPDDIAIFLRAVVDPLKHHGELIGHFISNGFTKLEERAVVPIDEFHSMRLHLFLKQ